MEKWSHLWFFGLRVGWWFLLECPGKCSWPGVLAWVFSVWWLFIFFIVRIRLVLSKVSGRLCSSEIWSFFFYGLVIFSISSKMEDGCSVIGGKACFNWSFAIRSMIGGPVRPLRYGHLAGRSTLFAFCQKYRPYKGLVATLYFLETKRFFKFLYLILLRIFMSPIPKSWINYKSFCNK